MGGPERLGMLQSEREKKKVPSPVFRLRAVTVITFHVKEWVDRVSGCEED